MATITFEGLDQLEAELARIPDEARSAVDKAVQATGIEVRGDIVRRIQKGPATGIVYQKTNPTRTHQASAPGESPATDTGRLVSSIIYKREGRMSASVGSELAYAAALEFGATEAGASKTVTIEPRPAWVPALEAARDKYIARLEKAMGGVIK